MEQERGGKPREWGRMLADFFRHIGEMVRGGAEYLVWRVVVRGMGEPLAKFFWEPEE